MNPDRQITFDASGPAPLIGDAPKLQQVVLNLIGNAVQHPPAGTPVEITVLPAGARAGGVANASPRHTLLVTDHGPGTAPQDQQHVFERFWRSDSSRDRHTGGYGLGLAFVASIVAAHGGASGVTSRVGRGTTIRVSLPGATITLADDSSAPRPANVSVEHEAPRGREVAPQA